MLGTKENVDLTGESKRIAHASPHSFPYFFRLQEDRFHWWGRRHSAGSAFPLEMHCRNALPLDMAVHFHRRSTARAENEKAETQREPNPGLVLSSSQDACQGRPTRQSATSGHPKESRKHPRSLFGALSPPAEAARGPGTAPKGPGSIRDAFSKRFRRAAPWLPLRAQLLRHSSLWPGPRP